MKKVNICRFGSGNWFFSCMSGQFAEAAKLSDMTADPYF
jgi:hypothetical protein